MTDEPKKRRIVSPLQGLHFKRDFREIEESAFEEQTVRYLLGAIGAEKRRYELIRQHEQNTGEKKLTLLDFCYHFDTFPMVLQSVTTGVAKTNKLNKLFGVGSRGSVLGRNGKLHKKWIEIRNDLPREFKGRPFGLVAKWAFMPRGLLFHTMGDVGYDGIRLHLRDGRFEMIAEPLEQFVTWLKTNWSP